MNVQDVRRSDDGERGARATRSSLACIPVLVFLVAGVIGSIGCAGSGERRGANERQVADPLPPPLPARRYAHGAAKIAGRWIVFGGNVRGGGADAKSVVTCTPSEEEATWQVAPPLVARHTFTGFACDGEDLYAVGEGVQRYDRDSGAWTVLAVSDRLPRSHAFATACDGKVYTAGGFPVERGHVQVVDLATGTITDGPPLPGSDRGDHFILLATLAGKVHAVGGLDGDSSSAQQEHWRLDGDTWVACAPHPTGVMGKFTAWCAHRDWLYVFEGQGFVYDPATDAWSALADPPPPRVLPSLTGDGDRLVMLGGLEPEQQGNEAWVYRIDEDRWERLAGSGAGESGAGGVPRGSAEPEGS